jgi:hypothetical protein
MKVIDYTVVSEHDLSTVIQKVLELLKQGFEPLDGIKLGTPVLNGDEVAPVYLQTMIRRA